MPRLPIVPTKELLGLLLKYGCQLISVKGSHHKVFNPATGKTSMVAIHSNHDVDKGAFAGILKQLGIDVDDFLNFINEKR